MKSFIYLDQYKFYSLSAQLFGGLTETFIQYNRTENQEGEEQKGDIGSGNTLSDIITKSVGEQEVKSFHDFAFTRFEQRLATDDKIAKVDQANVADLASRINATQFISVSGRALLMDLEQLSKFMSDYNKIGESVAYLQHGPSIQEEKKKSEEQLRQAKDKKTKASLQSKIKGLTDINVLAAQMGMQHDQRFLDSLTYLMGYTMGNDLEISIALSGPTEEGFRFSAPLTRKFLREDCYSLVRKYSRRTEDELTIFGIVTQGRGVSGVSQESEDETNDGKITCFRPAIRKLVNATMKVEESFYGRANGELIIDPIAVFRSL